MVIVVKPENSCDHQTKKISKINSQWSVRENGQQGRMSKERGKLNESNRVVESISNYRLKLKFFLEFPTTCCNMSPDVLGYRTRSTRKQVRQDTQIGNTNRLTRRGEP